MVKILRLIEALVVIESGGNAGAVGDGGKSIGCLQIQEPVILDVNRVYGRAYTWPADALEPATAREICRLYLLYWGMRYNLITGRLPTHETLARIWNGGPRGWAKSATIGYWQKVQPLVDP